MRKKMLCIVMTILLVSSSMSVFADSVRTIPENTNKTLLFLK